MVFWLRGLPAQCSSSSPPEESSEFSHDSQAQQESVEGYHAPVEGAHDAVALAGGGGEGGGYVMGCLCHTCLLLLDFLQEGGFPLHQLFQCLRQRSRCGLVLWELGHKRVSGLSGFFMNKRARNLTIGLMISVLRQAISRMPSNT